MIHALWLGLVDGWRSPYDLAFGMTWEDSQACNKIYDHGVSLGQFAGRLLRRAA